MKEMEAPNSNTELLFTIMEIDTQNVRIRKGRGHETGTN
jgi:hypothetical protein